MGKKYTTGDSQSASLDVRINQPLDLRDVVETYADLTNPEVWGEWDNIAGMWRLFIYMGMRVTVVSDPDSTKNGVYYLSNNHYLTGRNDRLLNLEGDWVKVGTGSSEPATVEIDDYTIKDGVDTALPTDTPNPGLHVVRVNGGYYN